MLIENDFFNLFIQDMNVMIHSKKTGYPLKSFDNITRELPRLKISSFTVLRKALTELGEDHAIGTWLPLVDATVSPDKMSVELIVNAARIDLLGIMEEVLQKAEEALDRLGVSYGRQELSEELFTSGKPVVGASGTAPIRGADAVVTYIEQPVRKPVIREDGSADYYEMNFVFPINEGDWLGEKIPPQDGVEGTDVFGNSIATTRGSDAILQYDRKSIGEEEEEGKIVLRALHGGALEFNHEIVSVGKHLVIEKDVGPQTGSITFDGTVAIRGAVLDGYSVTASGDISIEGNEGITNAKAIQSSGGEIYIKGGVFGGGTTVIEAQGNIYLKHANNCKLYGKEVHVGLYLFGSEVIAEHVYVDKNRGKIIGGRIEALYGIECAIVGNNHERSTLLYAKGIDKETLYIEVQKLALDLKKRQEIVSKLKEHTVKFEKVAAGLSGQQAEALKKMNETIDSNNEAIVELDTEIQLLLLEIKNAVPGQIEVTREAFSGTIIQIGNASTTLRDQTKGVFKIVDGVLNV